MNDLDGQQESTDWTQVNWNYMHDAQPTIGFGDFSAEYEGISTPDPFEETFSTATWGLMFPTALAPNACSEEQYEGFATPEHWGDDNEVLGMVNIFDDIEHNDAIFQIPEGLHAVV